MAVSGVVPFLESAEKYLAEGILGAGKSYFSQVFAFNSSEQAKISVLKMFRKSARCRKTHSKHAVWKRRAL